MQSSKWKLNVKTDSVSQNISFFSTLIRSAVDRDLYVYLSTRPWMLLIKRRKYLFPFFMKHLKDSGDTLNESNSHKILGRTNLRLYFTKVMIKVMNLIQLLDQNIQCRYCWGSNIWYSGKKDWIRPEGSYSIVVLNLNSNLLVYHHLTKTSNFLIKV